MRKLSSTSSRHLHWRRTARGLGSRLTVCAFLQCNQFARNIETGAKRATATMDWISIKTGCFAASNAIAKTSLALNRFVRDVRESRSDLDAISGELHSLEGVLDLLKDDADSFPAQLANKTPGVLEKCLTIVSELEGCISVLGREGVSKADKKSRWMASRDHIEKLRWTLEGYKSTLGLAVDLVALTSFSTELNSVNLTLARDPNKAEHPVDLDGKSELAKVAARISDVTVRLRNESQQNGAVARIQQFLDALYTHAVSAVDTELEQLENRRPDAASSVGEAPDSAIEMSGDETSFPAIKHGRSLSAPHSGSSIPVDEIDELLDEIREMPRRAPTPPPRSLARMGVPSVRSSSDIGPTTSESCRGPVVRTGQLSGHSRSWSFSPQGSQYPASESFFTAVTELAPPLNPEPVAGGTSRPNSRMGRALSQVRRSIWENPSDDGLTPPRPSTSGSSMPTSGPVRHGLVRRSSSRLSSTFRSFSHKVLPFSKADDQITTPAESLEPDAIFGVSLAKSMHVAKGLAGTHHDGGRSSTREYPLCVLRCIYFIRDQGVSTPHVFGQDADPQCLDELKEIFASASTNFGKDLDWQRYTVFEAADLILLFLSELPQPLVPESVGKRWITLSRQATISGSLAMRLDQGIDFWEEALLGLRGPARSLFKLLLDLWGDIADAAESNEMTAERLAGRVVRSLMHGPAGRYDTDFLLGLAFMIRKRSEYSLSLRGDGRKSNAAF